MSLQRDPEMQNQLCGDYTFLINLYIEREDASLLLGYYSFHNGKKKIDGRVLLVDVHAVSNFTAVSFELSFFQ